MLASAESEEVRLIAVKLFSKNSNLVYVTTIPQRSRQTDGQTDGRTDNLPWQVASRGKNYYI